MYKCLAFAALSIGTTATLALAASTPIEPVTDSFEGTSVSQFWTATPQLSGKITLSKAQAYAGSQALAFTSSPGGQRNLDLHHKFPRPVKGSVSVTFFDSAPGQQTLYEYVLLSDSTNPNNGVSVGTEDYDATCYVAGVANNSQGPGANCGIYPQANTTAVKRTAGWHVFSVFYDLTSVSIAIDNVIVYTASVDYKFDQIDLVVAGPSWRPDTVAYFDNFSFAPLPEYLDR